MIAFYDTNTGVIEVNGVKVSAALFEYFSTAANVGQMFRFVKNVEGLITIETLNEKFLPQPARMPAQERTEPQA